MPMDPQTITRLERLARIELTPEERERLSGELGRIIDHAGELHTVDTGRAAPKNAAAPSTGLSRPVSFGGLRPDIPGECLDRDTVLDEAPETDVRKDLFRVPRVIEK